jgi:hypothetical protein
MSFHPRQVRLDAYEVIRDPVVGPLTSDELPRFVTVDHADAGTVAMAGPATLRELRALQHGDGVPVLERFTGAVHRFSLDRWAGSDPDTTLIDWRFAYSRVPRWLWRLR